MAVNPDTTYVDIHKAQKAFIGYIDKASPLSGFFSKDVNGSSPGITVTPDSVGLHTVEVEAHGPLTGDFGGYGSTATSNIDDIQLAKIQFARHEFVKTTGFKRFTQSQSTRDFTKLLVQKLGEYWLRVEQMIFVHAASMGRQTIIDSQATNAKYTGYFTDMTTTGAGQFVTVANTENIGNIDWGTTYGDINVFWCGTDPATGGMRRNVAANTWNDMLANPSSYQITPTTFPHMREYALERGCFPLNDIYASNPDYPTYDLFVPGALITQITTNAEYLQRIAATNESVDSMYSGKLRTATIDGIRLVAMPQYNKGLTGNTALRVQESNDGNWWCVECLGFGRQAIARSDYDGALSINEFAENDGGRYPKYGFTMITGMGKTHQVKDSLTEVRENVFSVMLAIPKYS